MAVVSNSSPLIAFAASGQFNLLPAIFQSILIPLAVAEEITPSIPVLPRRLHVEDLKQPLHNLVLQRSLGSGERQALALAVEIRAERILPDDLPARRIARTLNLSVTGITANRFAAAILTARLRPEQVVLEPRATPVSGKAVHLYRIEYDHTFGHTVGMSITERVTVTLSAELVEGIDRLERNRSRFIAEAVEHELIRRRREDLLSSVRNPHPEAVDLADAGLEDWIADLPDDEALVDVTGGAAVRWVEGQGWVKESV